MQDLKSTLRFSATVSSPFFSAPSARAHHRNSSVCGVRRKRHISSSIYKLFVLFGPLTHARTHERLHDPRLTRYCRSDQAFSEMDFNMDGEVSFDEFVRWYSMSSALDKREQSPPQSNSTPAPIPTTSAATASAAALAAAVAAGSGDPGAVLPTEASTLARPERATTALSLPPAAGVGGASRLLSDLEQSLTRADRRLGNSPPIEKRSTMSATSATAPATASATASAGRMAAESAAAEKRPMVLVPSVGSLSMEAATSTGFGSTEAEKEAARERWLTGGASSVGGGGKVAGMEGDGDGSSAAKDLEKALELLCVLVNADADADTLIAALASCIIRNPMGRWGKR